MATLTARVAGGPLVAVVAAGLAVSGLIGARAVDAARAGSDRRAFERQAAAIGTAYDAATQDTARTLSTLVVLAPDVVAQRRIPASAAAALSGDQLTALALVRAARADGTPSSIPTALRGQLPAGLDLRNVDSPTRRALEVARDSGQPEGALIGNVVVTAVPHYAAAAADGSTELRRMQLDGWLLAVIEPGRVMAALQQGSAQERLTLTVAGVRLSGSGGATGRDVVRRSAVVAGQPWDLSISRTRRAGFSTGGWATLALGLLGAVGALVVGRRGAAALNRSTSAAATLERETRTIADLGPLLQQSLELAEVLPAVVVRLSDEFGLQRVGIQLVSEQGELVDVFALGGRPLAEPREISSSVAAADLAPGSDIALPLLRAGRTIGRLRFASREAIQSSQLDALRAAADLIAVATYNVELFEREQATVRRLQDLDRLKDAFLGTISHELRTPITAIGGFIRLLREHWTEISDAERLEFLRRVERNSTSLGLLVDDLLDFARLESQAIVLATEPLDVSSLVGKVVDQLAPLLRDRTVHTALEPGAVANAEGTALERVLANLLTNAAKFSPVDSRIDVAVRRHADTVEISVSDQGPGIAPEDRVRVFTRFYRGESDAALRTRGAGIGLAVVRELVEKLDGRIDVEDVQPHGTRMVVRLPAAASVTVPTPRVASVSAHPAGSTQ